LIIPTSFRYICCIIHLLEPKSAILIFTRSVCEEAENKKFLAKGSKKLRIQLASTFYNHTIDTVKASGLPYFIFKSESQQGENFGHRLSNAFITIFNEGYESVIAIGNDTPQLRSQDLQRANAELQKNNAIVGPSADGGVYLIGLKKTDFQPQLFAELNWETGNLGCGLLLYLNNIGSSIVLLKKYHDIDTTTDFQQFNFNRSIPLQFIYIIKSILSILGIIFYTYKHNTQFTKLSFNLALRGPPRFLS